MHGHGSGATTHALACRVISTTSSTCKCEAAPPTTSTDASGICAPWKPPVPSPMSPGLCHVVLLLRDPLAQPAPTARSVHQARDALLPKALRPFVHKVTADPIVAAMAVIGTPSATSKIILPRLARPAETVVAGCHASSVRRSAGVRVMVRKFCGHEP